MDSRSTGKNTRPTRFQLRRSPKNGLPVLTDENGFIIPGQYDLTFTQEEQTDCSCVTVKLYFYDGVDLHLELDAVPSPQV